MFSLLMLGIQYNYIKLFSNIDIRVDSKTDFFFQFLSIVGSLN